MKDFTLKNLFTTIFGTVITAAGVSLFLNPNKIVGGGASGVSIIIYNILSLPVGLSFAVINLFLLLLGFKVLGKDFIIKTLIGSGSLAVFIEIFALIPPPTENTFIAAIFGGVLYGVGIGMALVSGASTGGGDIVGRIIQSKFASLGIGKILFIIDCVIIGSSFFFFEDIDLIFYGFISMFAASYMIDWIIKKLNISCLAFVVSEKGKEISEKIVSASRRGVTVIEAVGAYTKKPKNVLICAMKEKEAPEFQKMITDVDENAFVIFAESQEIMGNGFRIYH